MSKQKAKQKQKLAQAHDELKDLVERLTLLNRSVKSLCDTFGEMDSIRTSDSGERGGKVAQDDNKSEPHTLH